MSDVCTCMYMSTQVAGKVQIAVGGEKLDAVVCVAGGWAGGNAASPGTTYMACNRTCWLDCYPVLLYTVKVESFGNVIFSVTSVGRNFT